MKVRPHALRQDYGLGGTQGKSYLSPAGALECVVPAGGANWAAVQEGAEATCFRVFVFIFCGFLLLFFTVGFCDFLSGFSFF
jgi:hypothetical protein